jgi:hypothetical protein
MIMAAPSWGIAKKVIDKMISDKKNSPKCWWDSLLLKGQERMWLKEIGNPTLPKAKNMQHKGEAIMRP